MLRLWFSVDISWRSLLYLHMIECRSALAHTSTNQFDDELRPGNGVDHVHPRREKIVPGVWVVKSILSWRFPGKEASVAPRGTPFFTTTVKCDETVLGLFSRSPLNVRALVSFSPLCPGLFRPPSSLLIDLLLSIRTNSKHTPTAKVQYVFTLTCVVVRYQYVCSTWNMSS